MLLALAGLSLLGAGTPPAPLPKVTRVHVNKSARTMQLYDGDTVVASYAVAVGKGGAGPKKREGDLVTPVGPLPRGEAPALPISGSSSSSTTRTRTTARASRT